MKNFFAKQLLGLLGFIIGIFTIFIILVIAACKYTTNYLSNNEIMGVRGTYSFKLKECLSFNIKNLSYNGSQIASEADILFSFFNVNLQDREIHIKNLIKASSPNINDGQQFVNAKSIEANIDYKILGKGNNYTLNILPSSFRAQKVNIKNEEKRKFINNFKIQTTDKISITTNKNIGFKINLMSSSFDIDDGLDYISISPAKYNILYSDKQKVFDASFDRIKSDLSFIDNVKVKLTREENSVKFYFESPNARATDDVKIRNISISGIYDFKNVHIKSAELNIFGGEVFLSPFKYVLESKKFLTTAYFEDINLKDINKVVDSSSMEMSGKLFGNIRITQSEKMPFMILDGTISNRNVPGKIKYQLSSDSQYTRMLSSALQNFNYKTIHGKLKGSEDILTMNILIRGHTPEFENGRSIELNLNVEENIYNLYRSLTYKAEALTLQHRDSI